MAAKKKSSRWLVKIGINYPNMFGKGIEVRAEPGEIVDDIPPDAIDWWLEQGVIEEVCDGVRT